MNRPAYRSHERRLVDGFPRLLDGKVSKRWVEYVAGGDCSKALKGFGQKGDHKEESSEILVGIGSGGNNKCEKEILEQKYKDNSHEISAFSD